MSDTQKNFTSKADAAEWLASHKNEPFRNSECRMAFYEDKRTGHSGIISAHSNCQHESFELEGLGVKVKRNITLLNVLLLSNALATIHILTRELW